MKYNVNVNFEAMEKKLRIILERARDGVEPLEGLEQELLNLHLVMPCVKDSVKQLIEETNEAYKDHRKNGMESTALTSEAMSYAYQIVLDIIERHEA